MELTVNERIGNNVEVMEKVKLVDVADIIAGQSPPSDTYNKDKVGLPFFQGKTDFGYQNPTPRTWCSKPLKIAEPLDILVSVRAPVGSVNINTENACIGRGIMSVRAKKRAERRHASREKLIHQKYLYYYFIKYEEQIEALGTGSTFKAIKKSELENLEIPLPPLPTQQKIAEILDIADQLRQYNKQLIEKYDDLTQSLFLEMFGDLVNNQKKWGFISFGSVFNSLRYGTSSPPIYQEDGIPFIRATNVKKGNVAIKGMVYISEDEASKIKKCKLNEGDLIIVRSGANTGDCCRIPKEHQDSYGGFDIIIEINEPHSTFYNFLLNTKSGKAVIEPFTRRAGQPHLNSTQITELQLINPPIILQTQFAERLQMIETQKQQTQEALAKSEDLFQSLLQRAFKGELN